MTRRTNVGDMTNDIHSEETSVVATYSSRQDAEAALSYLSDHGIRAFVTADDVHPPLQITEGSRVRVMSRDYDAAREALHYADMLPATGAGRESRVDPENAGALTRWTTWVYLAVVVLIIAAVIVATM